MLAGKADRPLSHVHIEIVPLLPEHGRRITRWPVLVIVEGDDRDHGLITPRLEATHARISSIEPSNAVLKGGAGDLFRAGGVGQRRPSRGAGRLPAGAGCARGGDGIAPGD